MRFYLAASYERRAEIQEYRRRIELEPGLTVRARWLDGAPDDESSAFSWEREAWAEQAIHDIGMSDALVLFTPCSARGGANVELGIALALDKPIHVVGPRTNIFTYCSTVSSHGDFAEFLHEIQSEQIQF